MNQKVLLAGIILCIAALTACGGVNQITPVFNGSEPTAGAVNSWPTGLPVDRLQPWEKLDNNGSVVPASERLLSAINPDSEFVAGVERYMAGGNAIGNGEATNLGSTAGNLSYAIYRIPLGGAESGLVSVDANLTAGQGYFVGLADYGKNRWQWHGPFTDNHIRLGTAGSDITSDLGSVFACVAAYDGAALDVIGLGVNPVDPADTTAPPTPSTPNLTPVAGGLLIEWWPVAAGDLAGYRIYYADSSFSTTGQGVASVGYLEGATRHLLAGLEGTTYVRISAVDLSGNESTLSAEVSDVPLVDGAAPVIVSVSAPSCGLGDTLSVVATGASLYEFDLDGDGDFDLTGQASGTAIIDTSSTGIIRPWVRGYNGGGVMTMCGGVSVLVVSNNRPVASALATPTTGIVPLEVAFTGTDSMDFDGTLVGGGWDFDGDGTFDIWDDTSLTQVTSAIHTYNTAGVYNAKLRVVDDQGAWDVDTVAIVVAAGDPANHPPVAGLIIDPGYGDAGEAFVLDAASSDDDGSIVNYEWDFDGDGAFDAYGASPKLTHIYTSAGVFAAKVRVTDDHGAQDMAVAEVRVNEVFNLDHPWPGFGRDQRHTRRSPYTGAQSNAVKWTYTTSGQVLSSPAIGADGTVYIGSNNNVLDAINPDGSPKWSYTASGPIQSSPVIGADGNVYVGGGIVHNIIYSFNPDGILRWTYATGDDVRSSPALGPDGTVYIGSDDDKLYAINPDGTLKWAFTTGGDVESNPAIGLDSTVYVGSHDHKLYAINADGTEQWSFTTGGFVISSPAIGPDGTVYIGSDDNKLYAINADGTEQWSFTTGSLVWSSPAIGADGTIYVGSVDHKLYALNPDGSLKWDYTTSNVVVSSPAIGADGTVYVGNWDGNVYAINPDGSLKWDYLTGDYVWSAPAIGPDGTVYVGSADHKLYAFGAGSGNAAPVAALVATPYSGDSPLTVNFSAADSYDPDGTIVNYEWDFDGDGVFNEAGDEFFSYGHATPFVDYSSGIYPVTVRVTDDNGATDTASVVITAHGDIDHLVDSDIIVGDDCSMALLSNGLPAIAYHDPNIGALKFAWATNVNATSWNVTVVDTTGSTGHDPSLCIIDGRPAIAYGDYSHPALRYIRATNAQGSSWGPSVIVHDANSGGSPVLFEVDGNPAIAFEFFNSNDLMFARATDTHGTAWGAPVTVDATGSNGLSFSAAVVDGYPAISYFEDDLEDLKYVRATNAQGSAWGSPITVDSVDMVGRYNSMAIVDGYPAIAYFNDTSDDLMYVRANDAQGSAWGTPLAIDSASALGVATSLAVIAGRPAIACQKIDTADLVYVRANDMQGTSWPTAEILVSNDVAGTYTSLIDINGDPAIAYQNLIATTFLGYFRRF